MPRVVFAFIYTSDNKGTNDPTDSRKNGPTMEFIFGMTK